MEPVRRYPNPLVQLIAGTSLNGLRTVEDVIAVVLGLWGASRRTAPPCPSGRCPERSPIHGCCRPFQTRSPHHQPGQHRLGELREVEVQLIHD